MNPTIPAKTILSSYFEGGWFGANYNMNLYRGCCHGCIYCDSRSDCYRVENFDQVRAKENALAILERELQTKRKSGMIITGSMSDSYNPFERRQKLTQGALALFDRYRYGAAINTKSDLVVRDAHLLLAIQRHSPVSVSFTVTAAEDSLSRKIEPGVCPSSRRFQALEQLAAKGIPCGILLMPTLPFLTDTAENILSIAETAHNCGAKWIYYYDFGVTLRGNQRDHFYQMLDKAFPGVKQAYIREYGIDTYACRSPQAPHLKKLLEQHCSRLGLLTRMADISQLVHKVYHSGQLSFFSQTSKP